MGEHANTRKKVNVKKLPKSQFPRSKNSEPVFEFTSMEDMLLTEILIEHVMHNFKRIRHAIHIFKCKCRIFRGNYPQKYKEKKKLVIKYVHCNDTDEKMRIKEQFVSVFSL